MSDLMNDRRVGDPVAGGTGGGAVTGPDKGDGQNYMPVRTPARPPIVPDTSGQGETHNNEDEDKEE